ncbi:uncharacterized protein [Brachionichthys hirsutus]|uniref:uncharacterized protein n=1 Tax=Brachionichthys hirsutus TaxID=412623 RepID=UPI0036048BF3
MKLLSSFFLLCGLSSGSDSSWTPVVQTPDVSVREGGTVSLGCCWRVSFEEMTLKWLKNTTVVRTEKHHMTGTQNCSGLTLTEVTGDDAGTYVCMLTVAIPVFTEVWGNGSVVTVTAGDGNTTNRTGGIQEEAHWTILRLPVIIVLAVALPLLLIALTFFFARRWRRAKAAMVIYEVPHVDSEEADVDKHSTNSSRGSSQWCQVPMYESLDYFERVQTKGSG